MSVKNMIYRLRCCRRWHIMQNIELSNDCAILNIVNNYSANVLMLINKAVTKGIITFQRPRD